MAVTTQRRRGARRGAAAAQNAYPAVTASSLVIGGTTVIGLPEVADLWAANNSNTVSYGANVALFPKARSAATATVAPLASEFVAVAQDAAGNTYAVGSQNGTGAFTYGGAVSAQGGHTGKNAVIVKYNSAGATEWAHSVTGGGAESGFNGVAVSPDGYVYAVGYQQTTGTFNYGKDNYGNDITAMAGLYCNLSNAVIVKYDSTGVTQWAQTIKASSVSNNSVIFLDVAVSPDGSVWAVGQHTGGVAVVTHDTGIFTKGLSTGSTPVIVKYDSAGTVRWAQSPTGGSTSPPSNALFNSVAADGSGVYAVGYQAGISPVTYDPGVSAAATGGATDVSTDTPTGTNAVVVQYDSATGAALWARAATGAAAASYFAGIAADSADNITAAGYQTGLGTFSYGNRATATGLNGGTNAAAVWWR